MKRYESKKWYFHPTIFIKILWGIFTLALVGLFVYFAIKTLDPFFSKVVGNTNGVVLCLCAGVMFLTLFSGMAGNLSLCKGSHMVYVVHIALSAVFLVLAIIFIASYGTVSVRAQAYETVSEYVIPNRYDTNNTLIDWFSRHVINLKKSTVQQIHGACYDYVDDRTEDAGSAALGGVCVWLLFSCLMIYLWFSGQTNPSPPATTSINTDNMSDYNEKILSSTLA